MAESISGLENWFSISWFFPTVLKEYHWENPFFLYLIPVVPFLLFIRWGLYYRFRQKFDIALLNKEIKKGYLGIIRFTPYIFMVLFEIMILLALARPQRINEEVEHSSEGIDIVMVMDVSESMQLEDLKPNRLEAEKTVARDFIQGRTHDKIGIVVFAGEAYSLSPLTTDYSLLNNLLNDIKPDMIHSGGSAIGNALGVGINRLRESDNKSQIMLLISDGDNTAGNLDPVLAAKLAYGYNIKIYTIGVGSEGTIPYKGSFVESTLNEATLRKIAETTQGKFFRASQTQNLKEIFAQIDQLEKAEIKETRFRNTDDYYQVYLLWGILFFLFWLLLKNTFLSNALED